MISPLDEDLHVPGSAPHWQESYYFNWADLDDGSFGLTRIGFHEDGSRADALLLTVRDGEPESLYASIGVEVSPPAYEAMKGGVSVSELAYEMVEPLQKWRVRLAGSPLIDLTWTAFMPAFDFAEDGTFGDLAHHHFEQCGTVSGTITVGDVERDVSGVGHRDKSWGPRNWSGASGWEWMSAQFGSDLAFNVSIVFDGDTPIHRGFVYRDGAAVSLREAAVTYEWTEVEHVPRAARIQFTDVEGEQFDVAASATGQVPLVKDQLWIQETPASFTLERNGSTHVGVGVLEHTWHASTEDVMARLDQLAPIMALVQ